MPAEDLDAIQLELETLLSTVALRYRALKLEYDSIDKEDKREKKGKYIDKQPTSPGKRKRVEEKTKIKDNKYFGNQTKLNKFKSAPVHSPVPSLNTDDSMDAVPHYQSNHAPRENPKMVVPKNDIPNKFWLSVEPYCMPITQEDIKVSFFCIIVHFLLNRVFQLLDDLIETYSGPLLPPIPDLGAHYSSQWAAEDLKDEQDNSNPNAKNNKRFMSGSSAEVVNMMKKGEKCM